jgi:hypothetical protein
MTEGEQLMLNIIAEITHNHGVSNEFLVSLLKLCEDYLNLQRVSDFAKENGVSTQGLRGNKNIIKICNYQLITDNL